MTDEVLRRLDELKQSQNGFESLVRDGFSVLRRELGELHDQVRQLDKLATESRRINNDNFADIQQVLAAIKSRLDRLDPPGGNLRAVR